MKLFTYPSEFQIVPENNSEVKRLQSLGATRPFVGISQPRTPGMFQIVKALGWDHPNLRPLELPLTLEPLPATPTMPRPEQELPLREVLTYPFRGLFMRMRLGKTWVAVTAMWHWMNTAPPLYLGMEPRFLVVVPRHMMFTWEEEINKFGGGLLTPIPLDTTMSLQERAQVFLQNCDLPGAVFIVNYEALRTEKMNLALAKREASKQKALGLRKKKQEPVSPLLEAMLRYSWHAIFLDESTRIKKLSSDQGFGLRLLRQVSKRRYILSGLPDPQRPSDFLGQMNFLHPAILGYNSQTEFEQQHCNKFGFVVTGYRDLERLHRKVHEAAIFVDKKDTNYKWVEPNYKKIIVKLGGDQERAYKDMAKDFIAHLEVDRTITAPVALVQMLRLHQITGGWVNYGDSGSDSRSHAFRHNAKLDALNSLLEDPMSLPCLIYCAYRAEVEEVSKVLEQKGIRVGKLYGGISQLELDKSRTSFMHGHLDALVCHPEVGGIGLTLHRAKHVIFYSNTHKNENRQQAEARIDAPGADEINYTDIIATGTVDTYILKSLKEKMDLAKLLMTKPEVIWG